MTASDCESRDVLKRDQAREIVRLMERLKKDYEAMIKSAMEKIKEKYTY